MSNILGQARAPHGVGKLVDRGKGQIKISDNSRWRPINFGGKGSLNAQFVSLRYFDLVLSQRMIIFEVVTNIKEN